MEEAVTIVEGLTSVQAVSLLKRLNRDLYQAVPYQEVKDHLISDVDEVQMLENTDLEMKKKSLDSDASIQATKQILLAYAKSEDLAPVLVQAWDEIKTDDSLFIETIIVVGLLVNLTLFMATSDMEFKIGKLTIRKGRADSSIIKEIMSPVTELIKAMG
jgi:hypothetical protein